jgi:hypothetical protein
MKLARGLTTEPNFPARVGFAYPVAGIVRMVAVRLVFPPWCCLCLPPKNENPSRLFEAERSGDEQAGRLEASPMKRRLCVHIQHGSLVACSGLVGIENRG